MSYRKFFYSIVFTCISLFVLYNIAIYEYDPLHIYSNPNNLYSGNMRYQARGYLDKAKPTGIIIGSSMLENTNVTKTSEQLGDKFINIAMRGSSYSERSTVLNYALKNNSINQIVYALEIAPAFLTEPKEDPWNKLYDNSKFNDLSVYYQTKYLTCLLTVSTSDKCIGHKVDKNRPLEWMSDPVYINAFNGICSWPKQSQEILKSNLDNDSIDKLYTNQTREYISKYIETNIFSFTDKYPSTKFYFVIPPYSAINYKLADKYDKKFLKWIRDYITYFSLECSARKNCFLYGFNDQKFTLDMKNYKDLVHYKYTINDYMIDSIKSNRHLIDKDNVHNYLKNSRATFESFDLNELEKELSLCK